MQEASLEEGFILALGLIDWWIILPFLCISWISADAGGQSGGRFHPCRIVSQFPHCPRSPGSATEINIYINIKIVLHFPFLLGSGSASRKKTESSIKRNQIQITEFIKRNDLRWPPPVD